MKNRKELSRSGVYFLIWQNENSEPIAYIGQATTILNRITNHYNDTTKDFWNHLVAFTTTDNSFTETDINFLERELIKIGKNAERYKIENRTNGNNSLVNEFRISDLLEYIEDLKILLSSLGFQVLQEKISEEDKDEKYFCKRNGVSGIGYYTDEWFVIQKWSLGFLANFQKYEKIFQKQNQLEKEWLVKIDKDKIIFLKDFLSSSPSFASNIIIWMNSNGWAEWKTENWKTLDENERIK